VRLKNINGTSQLNCSCGSWLKHWEKFSGQTVVYCPVDGCLRTDLVGAHVQLADGYDTAWYIYPMCAAHNQADGILTVSDTYKLVSANKKETCERSYSAYAFGSRFV